MNRRALLTVAAALVAVAATVFTALYIANSRDSAPVGDERFAVLVAERDIPAGTAAEMAEKDGSFRMVEMQGSEIPAGALTSSEPILGRVAAQTIPAGLPVRIEQWVEPR